MKDLTKIFHALLGVVAMILTSLIALGRWTWRKIKSSKWLFRSLLIIIILILLFFLVAFIGFMYDENWGRCSWNDEDISYEVEVRAFANGKYRVYNKATGKYTTPRLDWVSEPTEGDSLVVYSLNDKRGYINANTGEIVIDAEKHNYSRAWNFSNGLAAVMVDDNVGFINADCEVMIPFQYEYDYTYEYESTYCFVFHDGYCEIGVEDDKIGIIDTTGRWVMQPIYDCINNFAGYDYMLVVNDGKQGLIDAQYNFIFPVEYDDVSVVPDGFVLTKDGKKWQIDLDGNIVNPFMYDLTTYLDYPIGYDEDGEIEYAFADYLQYEVGGKYGLMNRITGEPITPAVYRDINMLSKDLFEVQKADSYSFVLMDKNGNEIHK